MMDRIVSGLSESSIKVRLAAVRYRIFYSCDLICICFISVPWNQVHRFEQVALPTFIECKCQVCNGWMLQELWNCGEMTVLLQSISFLLYFLFKVRSSIRGGVIGIKIFHWIMMGDWSYYWSAASFSRVCLGVFTVCHAQCSSWGPAFMTMQCGNLSWRSALRHINNQMCIASPKGQFCT